MPPCLKIGFLDHVFGFVWPNPVQSRQPQQTRASGIYALTKRSPEFFLGTSGLTD
ncbi:hypothetical protein KSF_098740 [Reticulibacter mediterranei]|uniref:Uncharacterized protein n=1 Tax=Reticulibacter mediterranei TaxID=2778369 RepID=A0A8J3J1D9_9CHLR|nr:hypothetical protein KSF_098740 [Reticulibacter mediterranei]